MASSISDFNERYCCFRSQSGITVYRPWRRKVQESKSQKVEKWKSGRVEDSKSRRVQQSQSRRAAKWPCVILGRAGCAAVSRPQHGPDRRSPQNRRGDLRSAVSARSGDLRRTNVPESRKAIQARKPGRYAARFSFASASLWIIRSLTCWYRRPHSEHSACAPSNARTTPHSQAQP